MGVRGPIPKPTATRRRTNKPAIPVATAPRAPKPIKAAKAKPVEVAKATKMTKATKATKATRARKAKPVEEPLVAIPESDSTWHHVALELYNSLGRSGQSAFYEASDWAVAVLICESLSRDLKPQFVGFTEKGEILTESIPMKGASMAAVLKGLSSLLVTEGDRRRVQVELQRGEKADPDGDRAKATVTDIRSRLSV